jgi:exosortase
MRTVGYAKWESWHFIAAGALAALGVVLAWPAWEDLYTIASNDDEYNHIFLVPFVAAWMFWARRVRLRTCPPSGTFVGPAIAGVGWLCSSLGYDHALQSLWHAGAVLILTGCILSVLGKNVLFQFLPAFVALLFLVPVPGAIRQEIGLPLQNVTAWITQALLEACAVPIERSGNELRINDVSVTVAEACNGLRMVFGLVLVSYAFAFSLPLRNTTRAVVILLSPVVAMFCNVLRLVPTVLLYGYADRSAADLFHDVSGWVMLPLAFIVLMGVMRVFKWALLPVMRFNLAYQ